MRSYTIKENRIGSVVSKILSYRQKKLITLYYRIKLLLKPCSLIIGFRLISHKNQLFIKWNKISFCFKKNDKRNFHYGFEID